MKFPRSRRTPTPSTVARGRRRSTSSVIRSYMAECLTAHNIIIYDDSNGGWLILARSLRKGGAFDFSCLPLAFGEESIFDQTAEFAVDSIILMRG